MVVLTEALIRAGATAGIGWNKRQAEVLGVAWPLVKGWIWDLIFDNKEVSEADYEKFLSLKGFGSKAWKASRSESGGEHFSVPRAENRVPITGCNGREADFPQVGSVNPDSPPCAPEKGVTTGPDRCSSATRRTQVLTLTPCFEINWDSQ